jgi:hypothetical protein
MIARRHDDERDPMRLRRAGLVVLVGLAHLAGCGGGGGGDGGKSGAVPDVPAGLASVNVFYSGHSLLDDPVGDDTASIATSLGKSMQWNQQIVLGSPVRIRTRGASYTDPSFPGYREGKNRGVSQNLDVAAELRNPSTISGRYDAVVLAERHDLASTLQFEDTVRYTRHFHERLVEGNPQATTYVYHAWLGVRDLDNPAAWIAYEKSAAPAWRCVAARINRSLDAEARADRVRYLPAGLALAVLVERAIQGNVDGLGGSPRDVIQQLMVDDVHETELGAYFVSLVNVASLYGTSPAGGWAPAGVPDVLKRSLQNLAWEVASGDIGADGSDLANCRAHMRDSYCASYNNYVGRAQDIASCQAFFGAASADNPFHFDATADARYWFPAPQ